MRDNVEFLNYIYQNSEMGKDTIKQLLDIIEDDVFRVSLQSQYDEYKNIFNIAEDKIKQSNSSSKEINVLTKVSTYIMINLKTLRDKSSSHISEMLIKGSTMGIIDITKKINQYQNADIFIIQLATRLLELEKENVEELKAFL